MTRGFTGVVPPDGQDGQDGQEGDAVLFQDVHFVRIPKEDIVPTTVELENWGMFNPAKYRKVELYRMVRVFVEEMDMERF